MSTSIEMPKYKCHKEVWALKIDAVDGYRSYSPAKAFEEGYSLVK